MIAGGGTYQGEPRLEARHSRVKGCFHFIRLGCPCSATVPAIINHQQQQQFRRLSGSQLLGGLDVKKTVRPINLVEPLIKENFVNNKVYES